MTRHELGQRLVEVHDDFLDGNGEPYEFAGVIIGLGLAMLNKLGYTRDEILKIVNDLFKEKN